jgi:hypothetical protein
MSSSALKLRRIYFFVVLWFTLWVGFFGFFRPEEILRALPWPVPPFHARFIGAIYLAATVFLLLSLLSRSLLATRTIVRIAFWWTGWLLVVTFLHWSTFDFARTQVWFWVVAYIAFPLAAAWLAWGPPGREGETPPAGALVREAWIPPLLRGLGILLGALALAFFLFPARAVDFWPWKISPFLAQVYSGPLLGLGIGLFGLGARRNWVEVKIPAIGLAVAAVLALAASAVHRSAFTPGSVSAVVWFTTLGLVAALAGTLVIKASRAPRA